MDAHAENLSFRLFTADDIENIPTSCQGSPEEILDRISKCGSSAMLVFEGSTHIGQLQFRSYVPNTVSPKGIHEPLYWMDFKGHAPEFPDKTLAVFCFHVGQLDNTQDRDSRYFGKGIGLRLLKETLKWAADAGFEAMVAKGCSELRPVIEYMGGMPADVYRNEGFMVKAQYLDQELLAVVNNMREGRFGLETQKAMDGFNPEEAAQVSHR